MEYSSFEPKQLNRREGPHKASRSDIVGPLADVDPSLAYGSAVLIEEMILRFPNSAADLGLG
jgi:hypothetical protein